MIIPPLPKWPNLGPTLAQPWPTSGQIWSGSGQCWSSPGKFWPMPRKMSLSLVELDPNSVELGTNLVNSGRSGRGSSKLHRIWAHASQIRRVQPVSAPSRPNSPRIRPNLGGFRPSHPDLAKISGFRACGGMPCSFGLRLATPAAGVRWLGKASQGDVAAAGAQRRRAGLSARRRASGGPPKIALAQCRARRRG